MPEFMLTHLRILYGETPFRERFGALIDLFD